MLLLDSLGIFWTLLSPFWGIIGDLLGTLGDLLSPPGGFLEIPLVHCRLPEVPDGCQIGKINENKFVFIDFQIIQVGHRDRDNPTSAGATLLIPDC